MTDPSYVLQEQYATSSNLQARAELHARFSTNSEGWFQWLFRQMNLRGSLSILEVGCGSAELWKTNAAHLDESWEITITDLSPGMIEKAASTVSGLCPQFRCEVADVQDLPFGSDGFSVVLASHMLYHVPDLDRALREVQRVLVPNGVFYATTNGLRHMQELRDLVADFTGSPVRNGNEDFAFRTDNGKAVMEEVFATVECVPYEDELLVTEPEPILDYLFSSDRLCDPVRNRKEEFRAFVQSRLQAEGAIRIGKEVGLFMATAEPGMSPRRWKRQKRERWDVYDAEGNPRNRTVYRGEPLLDGDYHLVAQVWIRNSRGEFLIQKRAEDLEIHPGIWATTAGSVLAGENSRQGAARELQEEMGITADPKELEQFFLRTVPGSIAAGWLLNRDLSLDEVRIQEEEVSAVEWATPACIRKMVAEGTFFDYGDDYFQTLFGCE